MKKWLESSSSSSDGEGQSHSHPLANVGKTRAVASASRTHHIDACRRDGSDDDDGDDFQITPLQVSRPATALSRKPSESPVRGQGKLSPRAAMMTSAISVAQAPTGASAGSQPSSIKPGGGGGGGNLVPTSSTVLASPSGASPAGAIKTTISMEYGDEYVGEVIRVDGRDQHVPHGRGTLQSPLGKHCYVGEFEHRLRDGYGKLVTERFVLWARWKANRPDLSTSARVDYCSGDKYSGYLEMTQDHNMTNALLKHSPQTLSNFSIWVQTTSVTRERWGEAVMTSSGSRYFGQWEKNLPCGFGCYFGPNGDRYVGMFAGGKFHGSGTLFTSQHAATSTTSGMSAAELGLPATPATAAAGPVVPPMQAGGTVYDGVWEAGLFAGEDGHVIFPCHTRVTADWVNACQGVRGQVVFSHSVLATDDRPKLIATFQWEPLLMSAKDAGPTKMEAAAAANMRQSIMAAKSRPQVEEIIRKAVKTASVVVNACKIFRRCFFFLYGTCGNLADIGSGGASPTPTGWCHARHAYGGCIHPGRGKHIDVGDTVAALGDMHSFVGSVRRWLYESMGQPCVDRIVGELDAENAVSRALLDIIMLDVHAPLLNLYSQAYAREEVQLAYAVRRLRQTTLDDFGVSFGRNESEKLFDPYADAVRTVEKLPTALTLSAKLAVLARWSKDIDTSTKLSQVKLQEEHLAKISSFMRERNGSMLRPPSEALSNPNESFASSGPLSGRSHTEQFSEHHEAVMRSPGLAASVVGYASNSMRQFAATPPSSAAQHSDDGLAEALQRIADLQESPSEKNAQSGNGGASQGGPSSETAGAAFTKNLLQQALQVESGSADDLLPIHQYVLCKSSIPSLYANTKLLVDLASDDTFVDPTSQDSFCITTLQACASIIPELFVDVRDPQNVITSVSMYDKRVEDFVCSIRDRGSFQLVVAVVPLLLDSLSVHTFTVPARSPSEPGRQTPTVARSPTTADSSHQQAAAPHALVAVGDLCIEAFRLLEAASKSATWHGDRAWKALSGALQCVLIEMVLVDPVTAIYAEVTASNWTADVSRLALRVPLRMHASVFRSAAVLVASCRT
jgi:hypothetical protein